jgi:hypothetical protein
VEQIHLEACRSRIVGARCFVGPAQDHGFKREGRRFVVIASRFVRMDGKENEIRATLRLADRAKNCLPNSRGLFVRRLAGVFSMIGRPHRSNFANYVPSRNSFFIVMPRPGPCGRLK